MDILDLKTTIESVISDLANNEPINNYIFKLQLVDRYLKNDSFSDWLKKETNGYNANDKMPNYRVLKTQINANIIIDRGFNKIQISDHTMPLYPLGEKIAADISTVNINESVIALTKLLEGNGSLAYSTNDYERLKLSKVYEDCTVLSAHKPLQKSDIELIVYKFKSVLFEMFMELNDTIFKNEINFDILAKEKEIDKIVNQTINAGVYINGGTANVTNSTLVGGQDNCVQINSSHKKDLVNIVNEIEKLSKEIDDDRTDIADAILSIREELNYKMPKPKMLRMAFNSIKAIGKGVVVDKIVELVNQALNIIPQ